MVQGLEVGSSSHHRVVGGDQSLYGPAIIGTELWGGRDYLG